MAVETGVRMGSGGHVVIGVDFGTESARALVVDAADGRVRGSGVASG